MTIKILLLAGVLSLAAASAAYATDGPGNPTDGTSRSGARMATDGPPGSAGDKNGRSTAALTQEGGEYRVASSASGAGGDISR